MKTILIRCAKFLTKPPVLTALLGFGLVLRFMRLQRIDRFRLQKNLEALDSTLSLMVALSIVLLAFAIYYIFKQTAEWGWPIVGANITAVFAIWFIVWPRIEKEQNEQRLLSILESQGRIDKKHITPLTATIHTDDSARLRDLISEGVPVTSQDIDDATRVHCRYKIGIDKNIFKILIHHRQDSSFTVEARENVLYCMDCDDQQVISFFLDAGMRPLPDRSFPLICAPVLKLMLKRGLDVNRLTLAPTWGERELQTRL